jgi:hypothetical protein
MLRCNLTVCLNAQDRYEEAEQVLRDLTPGRLPARIVSVQLPMASARLGLGKLDDAEAGARQAFTVAGQCMSPVHHVTLSAGTVLGKVFAAQGRRDEARHHIEANAAAWAQNFGEDHPRTIAARAELARLSD